MHLIMRYLQCFLLCRFSWKWRGPSKLGWRIWTAKPISYSESTWCCLTRWSHDWRSSARGMSWNVFEYFCKIQRAVNCRSCLDCSTARRSSRPHSRASFCREKGTRRWHRWRDRPRLNDEEEAGSGTSRDKWCNFLCSLRFVQFLRKSRDLVCKT